MRFPAAVTVVALGLTSASTGGCLSSHTYEYSITSVLNFAYVSGCVALNAARESESLYADASLAGIEEAWFEEIALYGPYIGADETSVLAADAPFELWGLDAPGGQEDARELLFDGTFPAGSGIHDERPGAVDEVTRTPFAVADRDTLANVMVDDALARDDLTVCLEAPEGQWSTPPVGNVDLAASTTAVVTVIYAGDGHHVGEE